MYEDFILPEQGFSKIPQGETKNKKLEQRSSTQELQYSSHSQWKQSSTSSIRIYKLIDVLWNKKVL